MCSSATLTGALQPGPPLPSALALRSPVVPSLLLTLIMPPFSAAQGSRIMQDDASQVGGTRVQPRTGMTEGIAMGTEDMDQRNLENDLVAADGLGEAMELVPAMLTTRATKMFTEGDGAPRVSAPGRSRMRAPPSARPEPSPRPRRPSLAHALRPRKCRARRPRRG